MTTIVGLDFPTPIQTIRITPPGPPLHSQRWRTVTAYTVTSLTTAQASPAHLTDYVRGHWGIEVLHHLPDITFAEDASKSTPATPPDHGQPTQPRIGILRRHEHPNVAAALRCNARDATRVRMLLGIASP